MSLQNLDQQLLDKVGEAVSGDLGLTQAIIDDLYTQAVRAIVNRVAMLAPQKLWAFAGDTVVNNGNGVLLDTIKSAQIVRVLRSNGKRDYLCRPIDHALAGRVQDPNDIEYATRFEPVFSFNNGAIYILPVPTSAERGKISHVSYPATVDASSVDSIGDVNGVNFPVELDNAALVYALMEVRLRELGLVRRSAQDQLDFVRGSDAPTEEAFTNQTTVTVTHGLGHRPFVRVLDSSNDDIGFELSHTSTDEFVVTFGVSETGTIIYGETGMLSDLRRTLDDVEETIGNVDTYISSISAVTDLANTEFDKIVAAGGSLALGNVEIDKVPTIIDLVNTAVDKISVAVPLANAEFDLAVIEAAESDTAVDAPIDTALGAILSAAGRVNTAVLLANAEFDGATTPTTGPLALANIEFDKVLALLLAGETDSEAAVNTAFGLLKSELDDLTVVTTGQLALMTAEIADALTEIGEAITLTDSTTSDIKTAVDAITIAMDKFRTGDDPSLFQDEDTYLTADSQLTRVKAALDAAEEVINNNQPSATTDAYGAQANEDPELVQSVLTIAQTEIQRAKAHLAEWQTQVQALAAEASGFASEAQARYGWIGAKAQVWNAEFAAAQAYGGEIQAKLNVASGYASEIATRLAQAQAKREEGSARINSGKAFLAEAAGRIQVGDSYLREAAAGLQEAQAYAVEVNSRMAQVSGYAQNIQSHIAIGQGFLAEAAAVLQEAQGFGLEASKRVENAQAYFAEAAARSAAGQNYLNESNTRLAEVNGFLGEANAELGKADRQLAAAGVYIQIATSLDARGQMIFQEYTTLEKRFDTEVALWAGVKPRAES